MIMFFINQTSSKPPTLPPVRSSNYDDLKTHGNEMEAVVLRVFQGCDQLLRQGSLDLFLAWPHVNTQASIGLIPRV